MELKTLLDCGDFDPQFLFKSYKQYNNDVFDLDKFKNFIENYIEKSIRFEEKTGIPSKHFTEKINLSLFSRKCYLGYAKVKDIYIYFDNDGSAIFLRDKKEISKIKQKEQKGYWLIEELDKLTIDYKVKNRDPEIDSSLYLSDKFKITKTNNFFVRYYLNSLFDIIVRFKDRYFFFFTLENINEYSFLNQAGIITDKDLFKIKRMLKINKIELESLKNE